jgi:hypothetical protein
MTNNGSSADHPPAGSFDLNPGTPAMEPFSHSRWSRTDESAAFFIDEDGLRRWFYLLLTAGVGLLGALGGGLWRLRQAAFAPPVMIGIAHGLVFSGRPEGLGSVQEADFDQQLADTVEVLFSRTEKGLPPELADFCAPEAMAAVDQAYRDAGSKYPAGYVQNLSLLEAKAVESRPGRRRLLYRGLLSSRSLAAAQTSPIYLECTFVMRAPTARNIAGWRLAQADALSRDDYYRSERERAARAILELAPKP